MRGNEDAVMQLAVIGSLVFCAWICSAIVQWIWRGIFPRKAEQEVVDVDAQEWETVARVTSQPRQRPDGSWERAAIKWETCDGPQRPNDLHVHDTTDPSHNPKTCKHCQQKPGYSGVSFRSA